MERVVSMQAEDQLGELHHFCREVVAAEAVRNNRNGLKVKPTGFFGHSALPISYSVLFSHIQYLLCTWDSFCTFSPHDLTVYLYYVCHEYNYILSPESF